MIYNFWNTKTESRIKYLLELGYKEIEDKQMNKDILVVNTNNKTFYLTDFQGGILISEFSIVLFE